MIQRSDMSGRAIGAMVTLMSLVIGPVNVMLMQKPWGAVCFILLWPISDLWARHVGARLVVTAQEIRLPSFWHDHRWLARDVEWISIDGDGVLTLMDRSGQTAQSLMCSIGRRDADAWRQKLAVWGYPVREATGNGRWRPAEAPRVERKRARFTPARLGVALTFALALVLSLSAAGGA